MRVILLLVLTLSVSIACATDAPPRYIAVNASGWVEALPDMLTLDVSVRATGKDVTELQGQVERTTRQVVSAARELGVEEGDIDSSSISIQPEYDWQNNRRIYRGQAVQRTISVTLRNLERYGELVAAMSRYPLHSVGQPRLGHADLEALQLAALDNALARGRVKAERIARGVGAELGDVVQVEEHGSAVPAPATRVMAAEAAMSPEIDFGKRRITASVSMRFGLR